MFYNDANEVVKELFHSLRSICQDNLEKSIYEFVKWKK